MGIEMLVNALLRSVGFTKEQFEDSARKFLQRAEMFERRVMDTESRIIDMEQRQLLILQKLNTIMDAVVERSAAESVTFPNLAPSGEEIFPLNGGDSNGHRPGHSGNQSEA